MTALDTVDRLAGYFPSRFPAECGGPRRQKAPHSPGLGIEPGERLEVTLRDTGRWNVMFLWRHDELYLYSTSRVGDPSPFGRIERVDPESLEPIASTPELPAGGHIWCGAFIVHENGDLYLVNGRYVHRLAPDLTVVAERRLAADAAHNTILVMGDGNLVVKDNRIADVRSRFTILDHESLRVLGDVEMPEPSMGRVAADRIDGVDVLYVPGREHVFRYRYRNGALEHDDSWQPRYRDPDDPHGLAWDTCLGADSVWMHDSGNTVGARHILSAHPVGSVEFAGPMAASFTVPNRVHRFGVADADDRDTIEPFDQPDGWILAPPVFVPQHRVLVTFDSSHGQVVAYRYDGPHEFAELWRRNIMNWWQPLVYPDTAELVLDDVDLFVDDGIVVVDLLTGDEKARAVTGSIAPNAMFPCPGAGRDFYYVSNPCVARVAVVPGS